MEEKTVIQDVFKNGATWLRADFHLHTKSDKEFDYKGDDNDFCRLYVEQLKQQNIGIGVITNHNKFEKGEFIALRKKAKKEGTGLFAGVEFSLKEGIHILITFDDRWYQGETDNITQFLHQAFYPDTNYYNPPYPNSKFDLAETVEALDAVGFDYFITLAHPDDTNGLYEVLQGRTREAFIKQDAFNKVLAVQKSNNLSNYNVLCQLSGRKIACVEGSDNAHEGIKGIGKGRITYIKIGDFNFEALKYALTDVDYRVSPKEKPEIKNGFIKSIQFEGGKLEGTHIDFSPELNNLIGIRGSGKSSILEIIRYTLGIPLSQIAVDSKYKSDLIQYVLGSGGKSIVTIVNKQKQEYRIEKIYGQKEDIFKDGILCSGISIDAIFDYPVYFGQKDLSNKDADFEADLIQRLIGTKLKSVQSRIENKKREVENLILEIKKLQNLKILKEETQTVINNSNHKLDVYKEKGVEVKLKQQTQFDTDISKIGLAESTVNSYIEELNAVISNYEYFFLQVISGSDLNKEIFDELAGLIAALKSEFEKLKQVSQNSSVFLKKIQEVLSTLKGKKEGLKEEFARIKREINNDTINPDDFLNLNRHIETAKLKLIEIEKSENKRIDLKKQLLIQLVDLNNLWRDEYILLETEVNKINGADNKLNVEIEFKGRKDKFFDKIKQTFRGTNIREPSYERIVDDYNDFIEIYKDSTQLKTILNENHISDFNKRLDENLTELLTYKVENKIVINYNGKSLAKHSLGQRASALILFLLAQKENDVLIIDQPEDDLDNQTIYDEVIKELKKIKGNMQFIFATHNANIPVLGDSEKVIACSFDDKNIIVQSGNVDTYLIQKKIVDIMEGGDEAFNRRKNIYSIWNIEKSK